MIIQTSLIGARGNLILQQQPFLTLTLSREGTSFCEHFKVGTHQATSCSNMLWRHVAATNQFVCSGEFCENLCRCNRILSPQQVTKIQSDLIFCYLLQRQNSVTETKIFTKILQYTRSDLSLRCAPRLVAATSHPTCTHGVICQTPQQNAMHMSTKFNIRSAFYFQCSI